MSNRKERDKEVQDYLDNLTKEDVLYVIKYGLRGSNAPESVTVEDIWNVIGCLYMSEMV